MTARQAIREELNTLIAKRAELDAKIEPLKAALVALNGSKASRRSSKTGRTRRLSEGPLISRDHRKQQILDLMRRHPEKRFSGNVCRSEFGLPHSSSQNAIADLLGEGKVTKVDETGRGNPIVVYRPTSVKPGEEVS